MSLSSSQTESDFGESSDTLSVLSDSLSVGKGFNTKGSSRSIDSIKAKATQKINALKTEIAYLQEALNQTNYYDVKILEEKVKDYKADILALRQRNSEYREKVDLLEGKLFEEINKYRVLEASIVDRKANNDRENGSRNILSSDISILKQLEDTITIQKERIELLEEKITQQNKVIRDTRRQQNRSLLKESSIIDDSSIGILQNSYSVETNSLEATNIDSSDNRQSNVSWSDLLDALNSIDETYSSYLQYWINKRVEMEVQNREKTIQELAIEIKRLSKELGVTRKALNDIEKSKSIEISSLPYVAPIVPAGSGSLKADMSMHKPVKSTLFSFGVFVMFLTGLVVILSFLNVYYPWVDSLYRAIDLFLHK